MHLHPQQISPGEPFDLFYFVRNHTDSTTYFVRAKIYDVRSGEVLATQALTQSPTNTRLFSATLQSPPDPQSIGRNIVSIATVYTDSGFTTKSTDYEEQEQYFLIRAEQVVFGGGGVDYGALREIVEETIDNRLAQLPPPEKVELPPMPFEALFGAIGALQREINRVPKEAPDDTAVMERLAVIRDAVAALPTEAVDLTPIENGLQHLTDDQQRQADELTRTIKATAATTAQQIEDNLTEAINGQELTIPAFQVASNQKPAAMPVPDISSLYA